MDAVATVNGNTITDTPYINRITISPSTGAYDCCVQCIQSDTCAASFNLETYIYGPANQCYLFPTGGTCSGSTPVTYLIVNDNSGATLSASNGNCGQFSYSA
jgi:hypothetical protein